MNENKALTCLWLDHHRSYNFIQLFQLSVTSHLNIPKIIQNDEAGISQE